MRLLLGLEHKYDRSSLIPNINTDLLRTTDNKQLATC